MPCYHPLQGWQKAPGAPLSFKPVRGARELKVPCGRCIGCRLERSRQWAVRCVHESRLYEQNCFLTLTYDKEHLPVSRSLDPVAFQRFMKRLRKFSGPSVRFFACGEYGDEEGRPHYHACVFNFDFPDKKYLKTTKAGEKIYTSAILERLWPFGMCSIGAVTFESAAYVARYVCKKVTGDKAVEHYEYIDPVSGEVFNREPEFVRMSLKPGIGSHWFDRYGSQVYPADMVVMRGARAKPPKYYDRLYERDNPEVMELIRLQRALDGQEESVWLDNSPRRLRDKEAVVTAAMSQFSRKVG